MDTRAVLACMAYVDLNPIRAAMAKTPEQSDYTSIQERILHPEDTFLRAFTSQEENGIPFALKDYLELVDWGGREIKRNKRGHIPASVPLILTRLRMHASPVLDYLAKDDNHAFGALDPVSKLGAFAKSVGPRRQDTHWIFSPMYLCQFCAPPLVINHHLLAFTSTE